MTDNPYRYPYVPVGGIIEWDGTGLTGAPDLSTPEKVAAVYGYGTWERYGIDRVTVGAGGEYEAGSTGGEKEHTLAISELPKHNHDENASAQGYNNWNSRTTSDYCVSLLYYGTGNYHNPNENLHVTTVPMLDTFTGYTGSSEPHNNMQPYIGTYRYRRIA